MEKKPELDFGGNDQLMVTIPSLIGILSHLILVTVVIFSLKMTHNINTPIDRVLIASLIIAEYLFTMGCLKTQVVYDLEMGIIKILDGFLGKNRTIPIREVRDVRVVKTPLLIDASTVTISTVTGKRFSVYLVNTYFANGFAKTIKSILKSGKERGGDT